MPTPDPKDQKPIPSDPPPKDKAIAADTPAAAFIQNLISAKPPKKEEPTPEEKLATEEAAAAEKAKAAAKAKKKVAAPPPPPVQPAIDEEKLGASIGKSIAEHTAKAGKPADDAAPEPNAKDAKRIGILERMEQLNGDRYKGITERYKESKGKLRKYAADWEQANPGEKFDENDDAHADFIDGLESHFEYEDDDYTEALADIRADKKIQAKESKLDERLSRVERVEKVRAEEPKIKAAGANGMAEYFKDIGDEFKDVLDEHGQVNVTALKTINDADPVKHDIVVGAARDAAHASETIYKLSKELETFDEKNNSHVWLAKFAQDQEENMMNRPATERQDESGRTFVRKSEYDRMTKAQREKHWIYSADELSYMVVKTIANDAKTHLKHEDEKFTKRARARGLIDEEEKVELRPERNPLSRRADDDDEVDADEAPRTFKPKSPSFSPSPKVAAVKKGAGGGEENGLTRFANKFIG